MDLKTSNLKFSRRLKLQDFLWFTRNSRAAGVHTRRLTRVDVISMSLKVSVTSPTVCALYSIGVIAALSVNHQVGLLLEN